MPRPRAPGRPPGRTDGQRRSGWRDGHCCTGRIGWTVTHHGHGLGAQDLGHGQRGVEGDVGGDVDHGDQDAGDADGPGEVSDGVLHLLDHVVQVVPAVVGEEAWRNRYLGHNKS